MSVTTGKSTDASAIRPFTIEVPEADLEDLRARIAATRWPEKETVADPSQGVQLATMEALAHYWANEYDWRKCEARLNGVPQFITEIDGLDIHFVHVRSRHEDALPLIVSHGWPGSVIEQFKIVDLLTDPAAHGASASDAFHVVIPNMPGYGFSGKPTTTGWDAVRIGRAWVELMKRLGHTQFVAAGGDWGGIVVDLMAGGRDAPSPPEQAPPELLGIHTTFAGVFPPAIEKVIQTGAALPSDLSDDERRACEQLASAYHYAGQAEMAWHPQTLFGLADSPVALAAWLVDHDPISYKTLIAPAFVDGREGGLTRDDILDNITLFWLTNTGVSSGRLYWEHKGSWAGVKNVSVPVAVSNFPDDVILAPRSWAEQAYPNLVHFNEVDRGGHFAAWEQPELYASELRAGFRSLARPTEFTPVHIPSLGGATEWLNSEPLDPAELRGRVVLVNFWTWTCINWLRQEPYVRGWSQAYRDDGLVVIGVHTPEFSFEHEIDGVRQETRQRAIDYPVAVDNDYAIWSAFANHYWPALYFADTGGVIRDQHFSPE